MSNVQVEEQNGKVFVKGQGFVAAIDPVKKSLYWVQEPRVTTPPPKAEKECETCGQKGIIHTIKKLAKGGKGLLKAEMGIDGVTKDEALQRRTICEQCDRQDFGVCLECECFLAAKIQVKKEKCPLDKWVVLTANQTPATV